MIKAASIKIRVCLLVFELAVKTSHVFNFLMDAAFIIKNCRFLELEYQHYEYRMFMKELRVHLGSRERRRV